MQNHLEISSKNKFWTQSMQNSIKSPKSDMSGPLRAVGGRFFDAFVVVFWFWFFCFVRLAKCSICYILLASQRKKIKTKIQHQRYQRNRIKNKKDTQPNTVLDFFDTFVVVFWFWFFGVVRLAKCSKCYILLTSQSKKIKTKIQQQRYQRNRMILGLWWKIISSKSQFANTYFSK